MMPPYWPRRDGSAAARLDALDLELRLGSATMVWARRGSQSGVMIAVRPFQG